MHCSDEGEGVGRGVRSEMGGVASVTLRCGQSGRKGEGASHSQVNTGGGGGDSTAFITVHIRNVLFTLFSLRLASYSTYHNIRNFIDRVCNCLHK